jgi:NADPH-dependent 2,4-dienoyl-CoA reductase/sulfur reductase-like enzyme
LKADIVVWCVGVNPNLELLNKSGIKLNGGVLVNSQMQTNYSDIYAAGDIVNSPDLLSNESLIHANWPNALEQGRIAGANMAGHYMKYEGALNMNIINVFDTPIVSLGLHTEDHIRIFKKGYKSYTRRYGKGNIKNINRVIFADGKFTGFQSVGWPANIGWLTSMLQAGQDIPDSAEIRDVLLDDNLKCNPKMLVK